MALNDKVTWSIRSLNNFGDIELSEGESVLEHEARHPYNNRGFRTVLGVVLRGDLTWVVSSMATKQHIKSIATKEQWLKLKDGSGDVAGCVRIAKALQLFEGNAREELVEHLVSHYGKTEAAPESDATSDEAVVAEAEVEASK